MTNDEKTNLASRERHNPEMQRPELNEMTNVELTMTNGGKLQVCVCNS